MFIKHTTTSYEETEHIAEEFAKKLSGGEVIAFTGGLGMGKTCFMRGLARGLGFIGDVTSPTFTIVNEYRGGRLPIFHFDMYRDMNFEDLYSTGYFDYMEENGIIAAEWSENVSSVFESGTIFINIEASDENTRIITITDERQDINI